MNSFFRRFFRRQVGVSRCLMCRSTINGYEIWIVVILWTILGGCKPICVHMSKQSQFAGVDFRVKSLVVEGHVIALQLWDTAGQER